MKKLIISTALLTSILSFAQESAKKDTASVKDIQEVLMTKKVFKKETDRFVYDISNAPVAKGNNTFDILKQTPLLSSTDDKTLRIAGKNNAVIFINGRKSNMDAESLAQFLKNTPAENIQKIEVITMPGSEFQVESSDGIINIILKKKTTDGLNGNMRMASSVNKYSSSSASFSANYRKDKLGINANLSGGENIQPQSYLIKNGNSVSSTQSAGNIDDPNKNLGGYINADYQLTEKSNIGLSWNTWANRSYDSTIDLFNTIKVGNTTTYTLTKNNEDSRSYNNSFNLNYEIKTDSLGSKLSANAAYLNYKRFQSTDNYTYAADQLGNQGNVINYVYQNTPQIINNFSGMLDYIQKFKKDFTVSMGGSYNRTKTDNDTKNIENTVANNNHFLYDENIVGLYLTLEKKVSEKFSGKIGGRYEITNSIGTSDNPSDASLAKIDRKYNNLLPYASFNYAINENNNLSYSFSSRMRRPSFWEINPVRNYITTYNYVQNNPFVKAAETYNQELTYMYKNSYFLILNHSYIKDNITQVPLQGYPVSPDGTVGKDNVVRYIRTNFGDQQEMSAMLGMQKSFFKKYWTTNFNIGFQHNINNGSLAKDPTNGDTFVDANGQPIIYTTNGNSTSIVLQTNNTIQLDKAKTWFLGVNYFFVDKQRIELGMLKPLGSLDLNVKKIWNNWTFAVDLKDILKTNIVEIEDTQKGGNYVFLRNQQYRQSAGVSIVYNFGNQKVQKIRKIDSAADDIKNRTR